MISDKDLLSIQQARILAENAADAQKKLAALPQEALDAMVEAMADAVEAEAQSLAVMSQEESDCGQWQDKLVKNLFVCRRVRQSLRGMRCVGVLPEVPASGIASGITSGAPSSNAFGPAFGHASSPTSGPTSGPATHAPHTQGLYEVGVPLGVIAALCPFTSPVSTTVYKALLAIKSGNAIIFSLHPRVLQTQRRVVSILAAAAQAHGMPEGALSCLDMVAPGGSAELMRHPHVSLVMITGVLGMYAAAQASGKPLIYGGTGNGPAFIERSADIASAVEDILASKSFDHGLAPSAEQCVIVDGCVEAQVRTAFAARGAYFMTGSEADALIHTLFQPDGSRQRHRVGQSAAALAQLAGFSVPAGTRVLMAERKYITGQDPYVRELLNPVLSYYVEPDWMHACEKCVELLLQERHSQTLTIHSRQEDVIRQFALKKPVARLLVNTGAAFGGMGLTTNLTPALTQGSGVAGYGMTSDNISPMNLIYRRKVGYGVRGLSSVADFCAVTPSQISQTPISPISQPSAAPASQTPAATTAAPAYAPATHTGPTTPPPSTSPVTNTTPGPDTGTDIIQRVLHEALSALQKHR